MFGFSNEFKVKIFFLRCDNLLFLKLAKICMFYNLGIFENLKIFDSCEI